MLNQHLSPASTAITGTYTLTLRLVIGWTYFSAFWRRLILANKLDPDSSGYIGEKFNHFLPNALGIKPIIEYLVSNPTPLWWAMLAFTLIEAIVGLLLMLGFMTRLMSIGVTMLALGILSGSGWLGTTCLDEWQIGVLGVASGFTLFFSGGGEFSLDQYTRRFTWSKPRWIQWFSSGELAWPYPILKKIVLGGAFIIFFITLFTNQYFHGGVWGALHNKSIKPKLELSDAFMKDDTLSFELYRVEGADVYGSFLIGITLLNPEGDTVLTLDSKALANFPIENIQNRYVAKIKPGKHSLVVPLGAKATMNIMDERISHLSPGPYKLILTDISGIVWEKPIPFKI